MPYNNQDYLMAMFVRFFVPPEKSPDEEAAAAELRETLSKPQRRLLLCVEDALHARCDAAAFDAFVSGFRVAVGIAIELRNEWYSFVADEEHRAQAAFERERDTMIQNKERNQNHE